MSLTGDQRQEGDPEGVPGNHLGCSQPEVLLVVDNSLPHLHQEGVRGLLVHLSVHNRRIPGVVRQKEGHTGVSFSSIQSIQFQLTFP
jgi:hypothetical protein